MTTDPIARDLMGWIDDAAGKLRRNQPGEHDGGYEFELAEEITARLTTDEQRKAALRYLVHDVMMAWPMAGGVLDECADESYTLMGECADRITDLAWQQMQAEGSDLTLRMMIASDICDTERTLPYSVS